MNVSLLVWSIGDCMLSTINIASDFEAPSHVYQDSNTNQILVFGGYVKVKES